MSEHAELSPSAMHRTLRCPGSLHLCQQVPKQPSSRYAQEGTHKHKFVPLVYVNGTSVLDNAKDIDGNPMKREDKEEIIECANYIKMVLASCEDPVILFEERVTLASWGLPDIWGTADVQIIDKSTYTIHVIDWKFGAGVAVYAEENEQGLCYAAGCVGFPSTIQNIHIHIVQPPLDVQDEWVVDFDFLRDWVTDVLIPGIDAAQEFNAPCVPGQKQCRFCDAKNQCPERYKHAQVDAAKVFSVAQNIELVPIEEIVKVYENHLKFYKSYVDSIVKYLHSVALAGKEVPNHKLVYGRGKRQWVDEKAAAKWLAKYSDLDGEEIYPAKLVSPAQAEKLQKSLKKDETFTALYKKIPGKLQLAHETDPRDAYQVKTAAETFADIPIE